MDESERFRVDSIRLSIDELNETKLNLEKEVEDYYNRRRQLEEEIARKTLKVAKFKAEQMDKMGESLDCQNQQLQQKIEEIKHGIKEQKEKQAENLYNFSDHLDKLSKNFINAISYYKNESLQELILATEKKTEQLLIKVNETEKKIAESKDELQQLTADALADTEGLSFEQRKTAWKQFQDELDTSIAALQRIEEEKTKIEKEIMN